MLKKLITQSSLLNLQRLKKVEKPWPHLIGENILPISIADQLLDADESSSFFKDFCIKMKNEQHLISSFCDIMFNNTKSLPATLNEINIRCYIDDERKLIRDWHIDGPSKKYHLLLALGGCKVGGELELTAKIGDSSIVSYPYTHNSLIIFLNHHQAWHRFYSVNGLRKKISLVFNYCE